MSAAGKRSAAALTFAALAAAALSGCASAPVVTPSWVIEQVRPVAVLDESHEWEAGVHGVGLDPGDRLLFDFLDDASPEWTMAGVPYDLTLHALDERGRLLGSFLMRACAHDCESARFPATARFWVEERPG